MSNTTCSGHHHASHYGETELKVSVALSLAFVIFEFWASYYAKSLSLFSDAAHNLTDTLALIMSWIALRLARRPANPSKTFGYHRVGILTALFNSLTLIGTSLYIFYEAYQLLLKPSHAHGGVMMIVAFFALILNSVIAWRLHSGIQDNINMRSAFLHMVGDAMA